MDIWIWEGRPEWDDIFAKVKAERAEGVKEIGVAFCGTPMIGKDLKLYCRKHSSPGQVIFDLHKENF